MLKSTESQLPKLKKLNKYLEGFDGYIAGGCFKNIFTGTTVKDIDIFFYNDLGFSIAVDRYETTFHKTFECDRFVSFNVDGVTVQLIRSFVGLPEYVTGEFDFTIVKAYYCFDQSSGEYVFHHHERFFEHLMNNKLVIDDRIVYPASTFNRTYRYTRYGYALCSESKTKLVEALQGVEVPTQLDLYGGID